MVIRMNICGISYGHPATCKHLQQWQQMPHPPALASTLAHDAEMMPINTHINHSWCFKVWCLLAAWFALFAPTETPNSLVLAQQAIGTASKRRMRYANIDMASQALQALSHATAIDSNVYYRTSQYFFKKCHQYSTEVNSDFFKRVCATMPPFVVERMKAIYRL